MAIRPIGFYSLQHHYGIETLFQHLHTKVMDYSLQHHYGIETKLRLYAVLYHFTLYSTIMELKLSSALSLSILSFTLYSTIMELKLGIGDHVAIVSESSLQHHYGIETMKHFPLLHLLYSLYSTIMELKQLFMQLKFKQNKLFIAPLWN